VGSTCGRIFNAPITLDFVERPQERQNVTSKWVGVFSLHVWGKSMSDQSS
jgi:hypothetical protein